MSMFGEEGQDSGGEEVTVEVATPQENSQQEAPVQEASDGHPAWAPVKDALGDFAYHKITPYLKEFDEAANKRITEVNSKYEPWKQYADQGVTPDMVNQAFASLQQIQQDPVAFYNTLAEHLRSQGLIQEAAQVQAQADDAEQQEDVDKSLREVYDEVIGERSALLNRPRPNDLAPRLPGVGGSAPTGNAAKKPEEFSRQESQAYLADLLRKENQHQG
jgi:hypothetical protein